MLQVINNLLRDAHVQASLKSAATHADAVELILAAAAEKGIDLSSESVDQALTATDIPPSPSLRDEELLAVSGGMRCTMSYTLMNNDPRCHFG